MIKFFCASLRLPDHNVPPGRAGLCGFLLFLTCLALPAHAGDTTAVVEYFPGHRLFPVLAADGLAHQLSLSKVTENSEWIGAIGGTIPVVQLNLDEKQIQASVAVTIFNRLIKTPRHLTVYTIDYKVDFPIDMRFGDLAVRTALGHISCHFADDAIEILGKHSIQHVNDYVTLAASYDLAAIKGLVYAGTNYSYATQPVPKKPWLFQVGAEFGNIPLHKEITLYGALDLKVREETGWGSTRSIQVGVRLFPRLNYTLRLAYTLRMGFEERGQFYMNKTTVNLLSAFIDF